MEVGNGLVVLIFTKELHLVGTSEEEKKKNEISREQLVRFKNFAQGVHENGVRINVNRSFCPEKLKEGRESRGLTIRELSERIGLRTHQALSKYENGKSIPPAEVLLSIMNILNLPYDYFLKMDIGKQKRKLFILEVKLIQQPS